MPEKPFSPNRGRINFIGILGGLAIGFALIVLVEYRDATFKYEQEVTRVLTLPVLAVVPLMQSDVERRRLFIRKLFIGLGLGSTVAGCLAVVVYTFLR
jgi:hypothetical protein